MTFEIPAHSINMHAVSPQVIRMAQHVPLGIVGRNAVSVQNSRLVRLGGIKAMFTDLARLDGDIFAGPLIAGNPLVASKAYEGDNIVELF